MSTDRIILIGCRKWLGCERMNWTNRWRTTKKSAAKREYRSSAELLLPFKIFLFGILEKGLEALCFRLFFALLIRLSVHPALPVQAVASNCFKRYLIACFVIINTMNYIHKSNLLHNALKITLLLFRFSFFKIFAIHVISLPKLFSSFAK